MGEDAGGVRIQEFGHIEDHSLARVCGDIEDLGIHPDRIFGTGLDTETAVDTFSQINDKAFGAFFDIRIRMLLGLNGNAPGRTDRFAHHASDAAGGSVFPFSEAVPCAGTGGKRSLLLRPLEGYGRGEVLEQSKTVEGVKREVTEEMTARDAKPRKDLREVPILPKAELGAFDDFRLHRHKSSGESRIPARFN